MNINLNEEQRDLLNTLIEAELDTATDMLDEDEEHGQEYLNLVESIYEALNK